MRRMEIMSFVSARKIRKMKAGALTMRGMFSSAMFPVFCGITSSPVQNGSPLRKLKSGIEVFRLFKINFRFLNSKRLNITLRPFLTQTTFMRRFTNNVIAALFVPFMLLTGCGKEKEKKPVAEKDTLQMAYTIRTEWVHDKNAFTQGLEIHDGKLYESTGQNQSWIGIVDINTGKPDKKVILDDAYFGEGITIINNKIYQLTWQNKVGFIYDLKTFKKIGEFTYPTEGWGITHDSTHLIMSDGSEKLTFLDTVSLKPVRTVTVRDEHGPVKKLNELEYVNGFVFANIWETSTIVKIDPQTGKVVGRLDLSALTRDAKMRNPHSDVLNGIAYHPGTHLFLITGKLWPMIYVLQIK
jgi:glutamine cyclotransferase